VTPALRAHRLRERWEKVRTAFIAFSPIVDRPNVKDRGAHLSRDEFLQFPRHHPTICFIVKIGFSVPGDIPKEALTLTNRGVNLTRIEFNIGKWRIPDNTRASAGVAACYLGLFIK
jgi:hypothetical protein